MLTDHDIAQLMNRHSLQGGNNDSPWWLTFARAVERATIEDECARTDSLLTILGLEPERCRSEGGSLMPNKVLTLLADVKEDALRAAAADVVRVWSSPSWNWSHTGSAADAMNALAAALGPNTQISGGTSAASQS